MRVLTDTQERGLRLCAEKGTLTRWGHSGIYWMPDPSQSDRFHSARWVGSATVNTLLSYGLLRAVKFRNPKFPLVVELTDEGRQAVQP